MASLLLPIDKNGRMFYTVRGLTRRGRLDRHFHNGYLDDLGTAKRKGVQGLWHGRGVVMT